ncbi:MAG TPA: hypothetical protein VEF89_01915 [Solirubrobacteraceae bacterium]|nr:hypothetical protein [Solirubrobacteraceae bacterium]
MLANDRIGDCVIAMMLHSIEDFHLDASTPVPAFTDQDAIGIALPVTAQGQTEWTVVGDGKTGNSAPGSWGGHGIP